MLPDQPGAYVRTETILEYYLKKIFHIYVVEEQAIVSMTRNADISYDEEKFDDDGPDFRSHMTKLPSAAGAAESRAAGSAGGCAGAAPCPPGTVEAHGAADLCLPVPAGDGLCL